MCTPDNTASNSGSFWAAVALAAIVNFAVGLFVIARHLYRATMWATPRAVWLTVAAYRACRTWYRTHTAPRREPVAALPDQPTAFTLADLRLKEPANR